MGLGERSLMIWRNSKCERWLGFSHPNDEYGRPCFR